MSKKAYLLETEGAERIARMLHEKSNGRVRLPDDRAFCDGKVRNLYRLLLTEDGRRLLSCAKTEEHFLSEDYSDYENFVELLYLLPSLVGSGYHSFVRLTLEYLFGCTELPSPQNADTLWRASLPILESGGFDGLLSPFMRTRSLNATEWVYPSFERLKAYESLDAYTVAYAESIQGAEILWLDLSDLDFISPDPYHANRGFSAVRAGNCDARDRTYLASQLLRVTGEICKTQDVPLVLSGDAPVSALRDFLRYLEKTDRRPRLFYMMPFDNERELERRYRVLADSGLTEVLSGILPSRLRCCCREVLTEALRLSAMRYPLGRLVFIAEGSTAAEVRMEYERFVRVLSNAFACAVLRSEISESDAVAVGETILTAAALQI
ncbi:MAG: hypothetical protein IKC26_04990 [Clostridia bacterium]|nr:hypothetical protein [Clostridia bacterium]